MKSGVDKPQIRGDACWPDQLKSMAVAGDWNDVGLVVRGERMTLRMNGVLACDVTDQNPALRRKMGLLALKMWMTDKNPCGLV